MTATHALEAAAQPAALPDDEDNFLVALHKAGFTEAVACDFEFNGWDRHDLGSDAPSPDGNPSLPVCMVARELVSRKEHRLWYADGWPSRPPFSIGPRTLFIAFNNAAELGCFLALGWAMPARQLDLYVEFKMLRNETRPEGAK